MSYPSSRRRIPLPPPRLSRLLQKSPSQVHLRTKEWGGLAICPCFGLSQVDNPRHFDFCKSLYRPSCRVLLKRYFRRSLPCRPFLGKLANLYPEDPRPVKGIVKHDCPWGVSHHCHRSAPSPRAGRVGVGFARRLSTPLPQPFPEHGEGSRPSLQQPVLGAAKPATGSGCALADASSRPCYFIMSILNDDGQRFHHRGAEAQRHTDLSASLCLGGSH